MWQRLFFSAGTYGGIKVRLHVATLVVLAALYVGGLPAGLVAGYLLIMLAHELGHAAVARLCGARVVGFDVSPFAGVCRWQGQVKPLQRVAIAWGGAASQVALFAASVAVLVVLGFPTSRGFLDGLALMLVLFNPFVMFVNLLPVESLDGHTAWKLFPMLRARRKLARLERVAPRTAQTEESLDSVDYVLLPEDVPEEMQETIAGLWVDAHHAGKPMDFRTRH